MSSCWWQACFWGHCWGPIAQPLKPGGVLRPQSAALYTTNNKNECSFKKTYRIQTKTTDKPTKYKMTKKVEHKRETEQQKNIYLSVTQTEKNWAKNATEMPLAQQNTKAELCKANWEKQLPECHRKHPCQILLWTFCWALFCFSWFYAHPGAGAAVRWLVALAWNLWQTSFSPWFTVS